MNWSQRGWAIAVAMAMISCSSSSPPPAPSDPPSPHPTNQPPVAGSGLGDAGPPLDESADHPFAVRVATYNVNFGVRTSAINAAAIRNSAADVVLLQETTAASERHLRSELAEAYPHARFHHCCRAGGLGILSRWPIRSISLHDSPIGWFPAWVIVVDSPAGPLQFLNVHLKPPVKRGGSRLRGFLTSSPERAREMTAYLRVLDPNLPTIIAGDFNEARGRVVEVIEESGFRSILNERNPRAATWAWKVRGLWLRLQLDHIAYGRRFVPLDVAVSDSSDSDHFLVAATLALDS